jgi:hypothetical protein
LDNYSILLLNSLTKELGNHYELEMYSNDDNKNTIDRPAKKRSYDLLLVQNSQCFIRFQSLLKTLKNIPLIFISYGNGISNYIAPLDNLYEVFNFGTVNLEAWGIPCEMQTFLKLPVSKKNCFLEKPNDKIYRVLYYPTYHTIHNADKVVVSLFNQSKNVILTIVSDTYSIVDSSFPPGIKMVSRKASMPALKKAHVVLASGQDAIQAMAYAKPCVIVGDYGLGGKVTSQNYGVLEKYNFKGRAGASFDEMIPIELLANEIKNSFSPDNKENSQWVQKQIIENYNYSIFQRKVIERINAVALLAHKLQQKKTLISLKPLRTNILGIEKTREAIYLKRGSIYYGETDEIFLKVLEQCDGKKAIVDILSTDEYDKQDIRIICENLLELWRKKLITFHE